MSRKPSVMALIRRRSFCFLITSVLATAPLVRAQSLVFNYEFNETSGTIVSDSAGDYDLTLRSTTTLGTGVNGGGLVLNAAAQGVGTGAAGTFNSSAAINLAQYTFTGWYQVSGTPSGTLLNMVNSSGGGFRMVFDSGNAFILYTQGRSVTTNTSSIISASPGEWVFFAVTVDTTVSTPGTSWVNAVKIYVANADSFGLTQVNNKGLGTATDTSLSAIALSGIDGIVLGNNTGTSAATWRALSSGASLDEIRLYDGVFSESQLNAIRLQSIPEASTSAILAGGGALCFALFNRRKPASL
jgi:hypothetical protein